MDSRTERVPAVSGSRGYEHHERALADVEHRSAASPPASADGALTENPLTQQVGKDLMVRIAFGKLHS
jgi:hypothetical protein